MHRRSRTLLLPFICFSVSLPRPSDAQVAAPSPVGPVESSRIADLWADIQAGDKAALERFWQEAKDRTPLQELIPPRNKGEARMTFVWRGDENTRKVVLEGTLPRQEMERLLTHLPHTDLWYRTERL